MIEERYKRFVTMMLEFSWDLQDRGWAITFTDSNPHGVSTARIRFEKDQVAGELSAWSHAMTTYQGLVSAKGEYLMDDNGVIPDDAPEEAISKLREFCGID